MNDLINLCSFSGYLKGTQTCEVHWGLQWLRRVVLHEHTHKGSGDKCPVCFLSEIPLESKRLPLGNQNWHIVRRELISTDWHFLMDSCFVGNLMSRCTAIVLPVWMRCKGTNAEWTLGGKYISQALAIPVAQYCTDGSDSIFLKGGNPCCWDVWKLDNNSTCSWILQNKEEIKLQC